MNLCPRAQKIKDDFEVATAGFASNLHRFEEEGNEPKAAGARAEILGSKRAMANRLNKHLRYCKECGA